MPRISNVFRRGAAYWWRRTLSSQSPGVLPITLSFSLWTKEMSVARHRAAAMTAQSEEVRMSVYEKIDREGLKPDDVVAVMRSEMAAYSQLLRHDAAKWRNNPRMLVNGSVDRDLMGLELAWEALAKAGAGDR